MKIKIKMKIAIALLVFSLSIQADSYRYECPVNITLGLNDNIVKEDWQLFAANSTHPFIYNQISTGHPDKMAFLRERAVESVRYKNNKTQKAIFDISDNPEPLPTLYLTCFYQNTTVSITKALDKSMVYCEILDSESRVVTCWDKKITKKSYP